MRRLMRSWIGGGVEKRLAKTWPEIDRKSVVWGKRVDLGGRRILKKKKNSNSSQGPPGPVKGTPVTAIPPTRAGTSTAGTAIPPPGARELAFLGLLSLFFFKQKTAYEITR